MLDVVPLTSGANVHASGVWRHDGPRHAKQVLAGGRLFEHLDLQNTLRVRRHLRRARRGCMPQVVCQHTCPAACRRVHASLHQHTAAAARSVGCRRPSPYLHRGKVSQGGLPVPEPVELNGIAAAARQARHLGAANVGPAAKVYKVQLRQEGQCTVGRVGWSGHVGWVHAAPPRAATESASNHPVPLGLPAHLHCRVVVFGCAAQLRVQLEGGCGTRRLRRQGPPVRGRARGS